MRLIGRGYSEPSAGSMTINSTVSQRKTAVAAGISDLARRIRVAAYVLSGPRSGDQIEWLRRGRVFADRRPQPTAGRTERKSNPLRALFDARTEGRGLWKWDHYLDMYHRHLRKFRGAEVHVLEVGVHSGGSLELWRDYLGAACHVYGIDINESCRRFEDETTRIFIGDQADREFWRQVRAEVPNLDVVIDDGGHNVVQQVVTLEALLPHLKPGGVYVCEDVHGSYNSFGAYAAGLVQGLNAAAMTDDFANPDRRTISRTTGFQALVSSIHCYPFAIVLERREQPIAELVAPQRGSKWEPSRR